jgi:hypothetical protein
MITDEQVERVARAIYEATGYDFDGRTINAAGQPYGAWALAIKQARAALEAARAPEVEPRSLFGIPVVVSDAVPEGSVVIRSAPEVAGEVEAVGWQSRISGPDGRWSKWQECDEATFLRGNIDGRPLGYVEVREVFAHPPQSRREISPAESSALIAALCDSGEPVGIFRQPTADDIAREQMTRRAGMEEAARIAESIRGAETSDFGEGMDAASDRIAQAIREAITKEKKDGG